MSNDPATYVEGIPVKISKKFRPPRRIALNAACRYQINTEILTDEYDFLVENETLKWIEGMKISRGKKLKERRKQIEVFDEAKRKQKEEEDLHIKKVKEEEELRLQKFKEEEELRLQKVKEEEELRLQNVKEELRLQKVKEEENKERLSKKESEEVLSESEITEQKSIEGEKQDDDSHNNIDTNSDSEKISNADWNLTEANQINTSTQSYYPSVLIPTQCHSQTNKESISSNTTKTNSNINFAEFEGDASDPFDSAALKSINDMEELAKVLQPVSINQTNSVNPNVTTKMYANQGYNQYRAYPQHSPNSSHSYTPQPSSTINSTAFQMYNNYPITGNWEKSNQNPLPINGRENAVTPVSCGMINTGINSQSSSVMTVPVNNSPMLSHSNHMQQQQPGPVANYMQKRQDLEDFYLRYYSNKKTNSSNPRSGHNTPTNNMFSSNLRSSTSVPDLSAAEDSELSGFVASTPISNMKPSLSNPSSRPSSTVCEEVYHSSNASTPPPRLRLPDPFAELMPDAQALVQSMAEMGFPRPRVARAVQKLGTDHKKLLEVLLVLQSFQDEGEDKYRAERGFYFYMGDVPQVKEFLTAANTLLDLGFEEEIVIEMLFKHRNDKDKCLEELIS